jgi:hypothetical protein
LRLTFGSLEDNSHASALIRRLLRWRTALATLATRLSVRQRPHCIVSTAPNVTEALFALGDVVVGVSSFCDLPLIGAPYLVRAICQRRPPEEM